MRTSKKWIMLSLITALVLVFSAFSTAAKAAPAAPVTFTILHTNDFHGQLVASGSNPGLARTAAAINAVRTTVGADKTLVVDAGDEMQGSLLSNLYHGESTIGSFNAVPYDLATFGNHEFDWGQDVLADRTAQANHDYVSANIVVNDTGNCATAGWTSPAFVTGGPYEIKTVGTAPNTVKVGFIAVTTTEVPVITVATATAGLCFKDPQVAIQHYYDELKAQVDVMVVLSHLGYNDGGYGYGVPVIGDKTLATNLIKAGKPVDLIIGGHSHTDLSAADTITVSGYAGSTKVAQAHYNGRKVGRADVTVGTDGSVSITWSRITVSTSGTEDAPVKTVITGYANDPDYLALVNTEIGYSAVDLGRSNSADNMMGTFIDDAIYNYLNTDGEPTNDVDLFFNNAGGIRTDWCYVGGAWVSTGCTTGVHDAGLLNYGNMFTILPFGNATAVGEMTGAQILEVVNYGPNVAGVIQPAGLKYKYYEYNDSNPGPQPWAWGAYDVEVYDKATSTWLPLDLKKTYKVGTNEFLAPAGGDGYNGFKYMKNITYWGDMLNAVNAYVMEHYGTPATAYKGPNGDGTLDGRIVREGTDTTGPIVPLTILHHNDSHGNLVKGTYVAYPQLVTLIKQEKLHNPTRTLLLSSGDNIQGDAMSYFFRTAPQGFTSDGTAIADTNLHMAPIIKAFNSMSYDAMVLGNHEFNFGSTVFKTVLGQANFPILQANVAEDSGDPYGLAEVGVEPYIEKTVGAENIKVAILGIGNHRIPNYELPSNIPGLTFSNPITTAEDLVAELAPNENDVTIALTHIGFTEDPKSVEVDANVDSNLAQVTTGIDAIIGGHSHTNPATGYGNYKFLPSIIPNADGAAVIVGQAYRYNNTLGEVVLGLRAKTGGGYEVASQTGRFLSVTSSTAEDAATKALITPYNDLLQTYNTKVIGQTTAPINLVNAYIGETNGANLQADASVYALETLHSIPVDFHLSGAMTRPSSPNDIMYDDATIAAPATMKIGEMFTMMPYENSLVVLNMNGPQIKTVLERAYRNYYYYKYVSGYGGYSYYTTCMIDTNAGNEIKYNDLGPVGYDPTREYVVSMKFGGVPVDFDDADTYYKVSTVNYLAAGSCNFNNGGVTLWPLDQIANDTQYYVRDVVIDYVTAMGTISPAVEGRLAFIADADGPTITINAPLAKAYPYSGTLTLDFSAVDVGVAGLKKVWADLDGTAVTDGQAIDLSTLAAGMHKLTVYAIDEAHNQSSKVVNFGVQAKAPVARWPRISSTMTNPKFIWTVTPGQTKYQVVLMAGDGTILKTMDVPSSICNATTCTFVPSPALNLANGAYKWKVRSWLGVWSTYSNIRSFNVVDPPTQIAPIGSGIVANPKFIWTKIPGATKYTIYLQTTKGVKLIEVILPECDLTTCSWRSEVTLNLPKGSYMWKVRAFNGYYGPYSANAIFIR